MSLPQLFAPRNRSGSHACPHQPADGSDLQALYARGAITDTEALNLTFVGDPTPVPKTFWGAHAQGAWHAW